MADRPQDQLSGLTVSKLEDGMYIRKLHVKVVVVADTGSLLPGPSQSNIRMAVADTTGWKRCKAPVTMENKLREKCCVALKKFSVRDGVIYLNNTSAVYRAPQIDIPTNVSAAARTEFSKPVYAVVAIGEVLSSPPKKKTSLKGKVISNHAVRQVTVRGVPTPVRDIEVEDASGKIRATLWRDASSVELKTGETIPLKDVVTNYSTFHKQMTVSVNDFNSIEFGELETQCYITIIGIADDEVQPLMTVLVVRNQEDQELSVRADVLTSFIGCEEDIDSLVDALPIKCMAEINRDVIVSLM